MANLKITLNVNNASFVVTKTGSANRHNTSLVTANSPVLSCGVPTLANGSNPLMIASCFGPAAGTASGGACIGDAGDFTITCSVSVGGVTNNAHRGLNIPALATRLYCPAYQLLPQFTSQYLALGSKKVEFLDHLCVQVSAPVGNFTQMLTPSLRGIERVVIVPHIATDSFITGVGVPKFSQVASPFCELTTAPLVGGGLNQVNVRLSGLDCIQGGGYRYGYEFFRSQMLGQGLNGGQIDGLSSGLISEKGWSRGPFQYYTIDCSRRLPENDQVTQSVELFGNNVSTVPLLLYVFVVYKREITIDIATGAQLA